MLRRSTNNRTAKLAAQAVVASPVAVVIYLFIANPEALGAPVTKLLLMLGAGCLAVAAGDLSNALAKGTLLRRSGL